RIFRVPDESLNKHICDLVIRHTDKALTRARSVLNVVEEPVIDLGRPCKCAFLASFANSREARCEVSNVLGAAHRLFAARLLTPLPLIDLPLFDLAALPVPERLRDLMPAV